MSVISTGISAAIAQVVVGNVTADDNDGQDIPQQNSLFTDYKVVNRYEDSPNRYMAGNTSSAANAGVSFFQLASKTVLWICEWTAMRAGQQPAIPSQDPNDSNWVFLYAIPEAPMLMLCPDRVTPLYRISGTYVYGHKNPATQIFDMVAFPRAPWVTDAFDRTMPSIFRTQNIMNTQKGGSASPGYIKST